MRFVKAVGLAMLAALCLATLSATAANAGELSGDFLLDNNLLAANQTVSGELENAAQSSLLIPSFNFAVRCHTLDVVKGELLPLSFKRSFGHATLLYLGCLAFTHKTLEALTKCTIEEKDITASVLFHVVRDKVSGAAYVLVEPASGLSSVYTEIPFGPLCGALAEEVIEVKGTVVGEAGPEAIKLSTKEATEAIQLLFKDKLMFGTAQAFLDGAIKLFAVGVNEGKSIGVEAGV